MLRLPTTLCCGAVRLCPPLRIRPLPWHRSCTGTSDPSGHTTSDALIEGHQQLSPTDPKPVAGDEPVCAQKPVDRPFAFGDFVIFRDRRGRSKLRRLNDAPKSKIGLAAGEVRDADVVGCPPGVTVTTHLGVPVGLRRPRLDEYVMLMRREAAVVAPKDAAAIVTMLDIDPGMTVLEAGTGSGSLTLFLARAVGPTGTVLSFDADSDHQKNARKNVNAWARERPNTLGNVRMELRDLFAADALADVPDGSIDGIVLDMMTPERALPQVARKLREGRHLVLYIPNIGQAHNALRAIFAAKMPLVLEGAVEAIHKRWEVGKAKGPDDNYLARPSHAQGSHTGFLVTLRRSSDAVNQDAAQADAPAVQETACTIEGDADDAGAADVPDAQESETATER